MLSLNYYDLFFGVFFKPGCAILKLFIQAIFVHATHVRSTCGVIKIRTLYECKGIIFSRFVGGFLVGFCQHGFIKKCHATDE